MSGVITKQEYVSESHAGTISTDLLPLPTPSRNKSHARSREVITRAQVIISQNG
jgi:hypothetical protein